MAVPKTRYRDDSIQAEEVLYKDYTSNSISTSYFTVQFFSAIP